MSQTQDDLLVLEEGDPDGVETEGWKLLIVDDEPEMHGVTRMALRGLRFAGRGIEFLSAYGADEACAAYAIGRFN